MSRKHRLSETDIGSDSFLDIIANIVGIVIILIVVAGVRIGQAPLPISSENSAANSVPVPVNLTLEDEPAPIPAPEFIVGTTDAPLWTSQPTPPISRDKPDEPIVIEEWRKHSPEVLARHQKQLAEAASLEQQRALLSKQPQTSAPDTADELKRLTDAQSLLDSLNAKMLRSKQAYDSQKSALGKSAQLVASAEENLAALNRKVARLQEDLSELKSDEPQPEILQHDATPVSEEVKSRELHFVVQNGKVAEVPIEGLLEQVKEQIQLRKDWLIRSNKHIGTAGPIRGFKLEYLVERETLSTLDQLRVGGGLVRIALTKWTIQRDPETLIEENLAQASGSTSRFLVSVRSAPLDTSCTFWVYPDSFSEYQKLKQLVHETGLRVAGRPLPEGIPIGGSPQGSRSASQ